MFFFFNQSIHTFSVLENMKFSVTCLLLKHWKLTSPFIEMSVTDRYHRHNWNKIIVQFTLYKQASWIWVCKICSFWAHHFRAGREGSLDCLVQRTHKDVGNISTWSKEKEQPNPFWKEHILLTWRWCASEQKSHAAPEHILYPHLHTETGHTALCHVYMDYGFCVINI